MYEWEWKKTVLYDYLVRTGQLIGEMKIHECHRCGGENTYIRDDKLICPDCGLGETMRCPKCRSERTKHSGVWLWDEVPEVPYHLRHERGSE